MRFTLALLPVALLASPVAAQPQADSQAPAQPPAQAPADPLQIPPELTDPATMQRVVGMLGPLSKAFMNLPVGELEAVAQGRPATAADRNRTLRDIATRDDPNFEQNLQRAIAVNSVAMQSSMKAMTAALPAISRALGEAAREIERATANLPSPFYPRR